MRFTSALLLALGFAFSAQAQTTINIQPDIAAYCELYDYPQYNVISEIQSAYEDASQAVFEFKFQSGACANKFFHKLNLDSEMFYINIFESSVKTAVRQLDDQSVVIQLRLIKEKFFKKAPARQFHMKIQREGAFGRPQSNWWVVGELQPDQTTILKMGQTP